MRTWCQREFEAHGLAVNWVQSSVSVNTRRGTLRGLHYQAAPNEEVKLVRCTSGAIYDVIVTQAFNNGQSLDRYVKVQVRDPRNYVVHAPFKYPADKYPIPIQWAGRRPRGKPALSTLITKAYDAVDVDETSTYIAGSFVTGTIGAGYVIGGTGGESRLLEFAQAFANGRKFHEYAMLTVQVPPA